ncbi:MAG TPA: type IV pilus assembly protein PilM, partial [Candidatus Hydrogenedentes bacterium]|nr:type IV pilus assembly protein PilM [Candidatus Hydrogenedentota bacterium]
MASLKSPRLQRRLVLDIGSSALRVCELTKTKTGFQLTKYLQRELNLPPSTPEPERAARVSEVLNDMLKEAKIRARKTVFGVPGQSVFTRTRALPPVPEHKVPQIVRYEIQQQIPFSLDQIALGYQVLARTEAGGYDVLMAAIKVDVVDKRLDAIKSAKRAVGIVDVCPVAAYNWLKTAGEFGAHGECVALIDLGASTTDIVIEREGQFRFTRSLNLGGNDITNAIGNTFNMDFEEAERLKRQRGFAPTGDAQRDGKGGEVIGQLLNRLVTEINRSFAYFRSQPGGGPVSRVVITGGGACLRNIVPYFQRQLNMEVRIAQPLAGLAIAPAAQAVNEHPEQAAVVLGLALRNCGEVPIGINLIPPRIIEGARRKQQYVYWAASLVTVLAIFATIIPDMQNKIVEVERHTNMARDVIGKYDPRLVDNPTSACQYDGDLNIAKNYIKG